MKRPFAVTGFASLAVLLVLNLIQSNSVAYCVFFISIISGALSLLVRNTRQALTVPVCLFTAAFACLLFLNFNESRQQTQALTGDSISVEATVAEAPYRKSSNGRHYCVLNLKTVDGKAAKGRLRLSFSPSKDGIDERQLTVGSGISFKGKVYIPAKEEKNISRYFTAESIFLSAYSPKEITVTEGAKGVNYYIQSLREHIIKILRYSFGDRIAGLLCGILTGDKSLISPDIYDALCSSGIAHLMAVSGLHLSVWVIAFSYLLPKKGKDSVIGGIMLALAVIFIMLIAGMSESVKRAGFMSLVFIAGSMSRRRADGINSLGFSVSAMIIINPACVLSISMQLSVLSTLAILTLGRLLSKNFSAYLNKQRIPSALKAVIRYSADIFFISISVLIFTAPVLIYAFGGISTVSAWTNILVAPVAAPLLICAGVFSLLSAVPAVSAVLAVIIKAMTEYIIVIAQLFSRSENAFLVFEKENILLYFAAITALASIVLPLSLKRVRGKNTVALILMLFAASLILTDNSLSVESIRIHLTHYGDTYAVAAEKDRHALLLTDTDEYEKELFISELGDKRIDVDAFLQTENPYVIVSNHNGKHLSTEMINSIFDNVVLNNCTDSQMLEAFGKYIQIFYGEALHYDDSCDIIIEMIENDATVYISGKSVSLKEHKHLLIELREDGKIILRGGSSWLNLMKSN